MVMVWRREGLWHYILEAFSDCAIDGFLVVCCRRGCDSISLRETVTVLEEGELWW